MVSKIIKELDPALQVLAQEFLDRCAAFGIEAHLIRTFSHRGDLAGC
jgi:hypothetical protein